MTQDTAATAAFLTELQQKSQALREAVPQLLQSQSPEEMTEECIRRAELKNDWQRLYNAIKDRIAADESTLRLIRQAKGDQTTDIDKLDGHKWNLISERRSHGA